MQECAAGKFHDASSTVCVFFFWLDACGNRLHWSLEKVEGTNVTLDAAQRPGHRKDRNFEPSRRIPALKSLSLLAVFAAVEKCEACASASVRRYYCSSSR